MQYRYGGCYDKNLKETISYIEATEDRIKDYSQVGLPSCGLTLHCIDVLLRFIFR